jgi:hypothetical protein
MNKKFPEWFHLYKSNVEFLRGEADWSNWAKQTCAIVQGKQLWTALHKKTLPNVNGKHFFMNILCTESFWPQKKHNTTLLFGGTLLKHGCHFEHQNKCLNIHVCICYVDCHEGGLCCYLVIHTENLLCPLQLFYFQLWPIYWLSLI